MSFPLADRVGRLSSPAVSRTVERAAELEAKGVELTYLMRGEPDFDTPVHIVRAARRALAAGKTHYGPAQGIIELRRAVAERIERDFGLAVDPKAEVLITSGATMGLFVAIMAFVNRGDEVILFDPVYDPYPSVVRLAGGVPVRVPAEREGDRFGVPLAAAEAAVTSRTRAIVLNNPWNPTGTVMTRAELEGLVQIAEAHDLLLVADEIYEKLVFERAHLHLAALSPAARKRTITVNSLSKTYAMTGWRVGYNLAPPRLTRAMVRVAQQFSRSAATFIQWAAVDALSGPQECVEEMVAAYTRRRSLLVGRLGALPDAERRGPEGTFFSLLDVRPYGLRSQEMAEFLLQKARVVLVPGSAYGPAGEGTIRLSFAYGDETLRRGLDAAIAAIKQLERDDND